MVAKTQTSTDHHTTIYLDYSEKLLKPKFRDACALCEINSTSELTILAHKNASKKKSPASVADWEA